ncbi:MAG: hypothetical protein AABY13_00345 [Nanoarchaeota archaeon]
MFTRLFFFRGQGLRHFTFFTEQRQLTGGDIIVWKVDWQGHAPNGAGGVPEPIVQKPKEQNQGNATSNVTNTTAD